MVAFEETVVLDDSFIMMCTNLRSYGGSSSSPHEVDSNIRKLVKQSRILFRFISKSSIINGWIALHIRVGIQFGLRNRQHEQVVRVRKKLHV